MGARPLLPRRHAAMVEPWPEQIRSCLPGVPEWEQKKKMQWWTIGKWSFNGDFPWWFNGESWDDNGMIIPSWEMNLTFWILFDFGETSFFSGHIFGGSSVNLRFLGSLQIKIPWYSNRLPCMRNYFGFPQRLDSDCQELSVTLSRFLSDRATAPFLVSPG